MRASGCPTSVGGKTYMHPPATDRLHPMIDWLTTKATFAAYQTSVALGITLLPVALLAKHLGVTIPVHRLIQRTESAYEASR